MKGVFTATTFAAPGICLRGNQRLIPLFFVDCCLSLTHLLLLLSQLPPRQPQKQDHVQGDSQEASQRRTSCYSEPIPFKGNPKKAKRSAMESHRNGNSFTMASQKDGRDQRSLSTFGHEKIAQRDNCRVFGVGQGASFEQGPPERIAQREADLSPA